MTRPVIVLSHCLADRACRYNGQALNDPIVGMLDGFVTFKPVCPEVAIGLGVPRQPIQMVDSDDGPRLVQPATGLDVTEKMHAFSKRFLKALGPVDGFLIKGRSPSCGPSNVRIYASVKGRVAGKGPGLFAAAMIERFPAMAIEEEGRLYDFSIRDHFLTRVFSRARLRAVRSMAALVKFQAAHKLLLLAHNQEALRRLGRIVANHEKLRFPEVLERYGEEFDRALAKPARASSRINVFEHAFGYFSKDLAPAEKRHFHQLISRYRASRVPPSAVTTLLRSWVERFETSYLADQILFEPYPEDLVSLLDSGKGRGPR